MALQIFIAQSNKPTNKKYIHQWSRVLVESRMVWAKFIFTTPMQRETAMKELNVDKSGVHHIDGIPHIKSKNPQILSFGIHLKLLRGKSMWANHLRDVVDSMDSIYVRIT